MSDKDVEVLKRDVQTILHYLHNDNGTGQPGLVSEVKTLKDSFNKFVIGYETDKKVRAAKMAAYGTVGGVIVLIGKWIVSLIF